MHFITAEERGKISLVRDRSVCLRGRGSVRVSKAKRPDTERGECGKTPDKECCVSGFVGMEVQWWC